MVVALHASQQNIHLKNKHENRLTPFRDYSEQQLYTSIIYNRWFHMFTELNLYRIIRYIFVPDPFIYLPTISHNGPSEMRGRFLTIHSSEGRIISAQLTPFSQSITITVRQFCNC